MKQSQKRARFKKQRRLQVELPGLGKAGALERRPYPPGEHGQKRRKFSEYALQLEEKQKILAHYCLRESQLRRFVAEAKRKADQNWVSRLITLLELRLDSVVFRLGFAPSIPSAKQLVSHRKILVNGKAVDIRSIVLREGDEIRIKESSATHQDYLWARQTPRLPLPDYLTKESRDQGDIGKITALPALGDVPFAFNDGLFTSYYSLKG